MPSLIEEPFGYERWWITLNCPGSFLGCKPNGENTMSSRGIISKGPAILPWLASLDNFSSTTSGYSCDDLRLGGGDEEW